MRTLSMTFLILVLSIPLFSQESPNVDLSPAAGVLMELKVNKFISDGEIVVLKGSKSSNIYFLYKIHRGNKPILSIYKNTIIQGKSAMSRANIEQLECTRGVYLYKKEVMHQIGYFSTLGVEAMRVIEN